MFVLPMANFCNCFSSAYQVHVSLFLVFCFQYQRNRLPEKCRLRNDLLCVTWDV